MHPDAKIIWIDAHIDANTPETSPSENVHGMPVAMLAGLVPEHKDHCLNLKTDIVYVGIRSYEPEEYELIKKERVPVIPVEQCENEKLEEIQKKIESHFFPDGIKTPIWISFDIDGLDSNEFLSTGTPEGGGIKYEFITEFFKRFIPEAVGMDITEVNFALTSGEERKKDELRFQDIFKNILEAGTSL